MFNAASLYAEWSALTILMYQLSINNSRSGQALVMSHVSSCHQTSSVFLGPANFRPGIRIVGFPLRQA
jgi:hypothetical protein